MKKKSENKYWTYKRRDEFVNKLKELAGTQAAVAELLGINETTVSRWRSGEGYPSIDQLLTIANHYHCTVDYLLGNDSSDSPKIETLADVAKCLFRLDDEAIEVSTTSEIEEIENDSFTIASKCGLIKFRNAVIADFFEQWRDILKIRKARGGEKTYKYWKDIKLKELKEHQKKWDYNDIISHTFLMHDVLLKEYEEYKRYRENGMDYFDWCTVSREDYDLINSRYDIPSEVSEWYKPRDDFYPSN